jgi:hypothetical protein
MGTTLLTRATSESASPSGTPTPKGSGGSSAASSPAVGANLAPTQSPSNAIESSTLDASRGTTEAIASVLSHSPDAIAAASDPASEWVAPSPGGLALDLHLGPLSLREGSAPDGASTNAGFAPVGRVPTDCPDGPAVSTVVRGGLASAGDGSTIAGSPAKGDPAAGPADLARAWDAAGDWLADLVAIELGKAADRAQHLAPLFLAAGICVAWGNYSHSARSSHRERDEERAFAGSLAGRRA